MAENVHGDRDRHKYQKLVIIVRSAQERYRSGHNGADSKSDGRCIPARGFESHPLRHYVQETLGYFPGTSRPDIVFPSGSEFIDYRYGLPDRQADTQRRPAMAR